MRLAAAQTCTQSCSTRTPASACSRSSSTPAKTRSKDSPASPRSAIWARPALPRSALSGYFDWEKKDYDRIAVAEQTEVLALVGDVALDAESGGRKVHAHVVLGKRDGAACGGHLLAARVRPTLEVVLNESPAHLKRVHDPESGLALIRIDARR